MGIYQIPIIGPWAAKVTRIEKLFTMPCMPEPEIWVLGFFVSAPQLAFSLIGPDCFTDTSARFGRPHNRKRRGTFNIQELFPKTAGPADGLGWYVFKSTKFLLRVGWYMTVIDATLDFVINGTSHAYQYSGCTNPGTAYGKCEMINTVPELFPAGHGTISSWVRVGDNILSAGPTGVACPPGYIPAASFTIKQGLNQFFPLPDCNFTVRLVDTLTGAETEAFAPEPDGAGGRQSSQFFYAPSLNDGPHNYVLKFEKDEGVMFIESATLTVYGGPKINIRDTSCFGKAKQA